MADAVPFEQVALFPAKGDNAAIAKHQIDAGTRIDYNGSTLELPHTVLLGHRFAVQPIKTGEFVTSWNSPVGTASTDIAPGDLIRNEVMLEKLPSMPELKGITLPKAHNIVDEVPDYVLDEQNFTPPVPLPHLENAPTFEGYLRSGNRGTGTRNNLVILGTTASTGAFVRKLEEKIQDDGMLKGFKNVDNVVALAHTEGSGETMTPEHRERTLRTLAGLAVNPNVGGIIAFDRRKDQITNKDLIDWMKAHHYPIDNVPHNFITMGDFQPTMAEGIQAVKEMLPKVNATKREPRPVSELKIALQCGGSDAFSGISGNPLAAAVAKRIIQYGGSASLTETDELNSADAYVLHNVKDIPTAKAFLKKREEFEANLNRYGKSGKDNPSGGNMLRGLFSIYIKSKGAATKKDPEVGIEHVIEYSDRMNKPGFYFMNGPGNDLEGQTGQWAGGCNMVFFVTGNGSITNFPLGPTIKYITTTSQYKQLGGNDPKQLGDPKSLPVLGNTDGGSMDVNAGRYLDGVPMDKLADETLDLAIKIAGGQKCKGEEGGLAQLQLWRAEPDISQVDKVHHMRESGEPINIIPATELPEMHFAGLKKGDAVVSQQLELMMPTSLCSSGWARRIAKGLGQDEALAGGAGQKFHSLPHTEGCGATNSAEHLNTTFGYMAHPSVAHTLLLEHGCESMHAGRILDIMEGKTHDFTPISDDMKKSGLDREKIGRVSLQKDGGIAKAVSKVRGWFQDTLGQTAAPVAAQGSWKDVRLGLMSYGAMSQTDASEMAELTRNTVTAGGTVVIPSNDPLLKSETFTKAVFGETKPHATLSYGQNVTKRGLHIMDAPSKEWGETMTGLGASGVESIIAHSEDSPITSHPFIPVIHVTTNGTSQDFDLKLQDGKSGQAALQTMLEKTLSREYTPKMTAYGNTVYQISRGYDSVTL